MSAPSVPSGAPTKREALRALLSDGAWHHMDELRRVGGWRYGARLLEIRQEHHVAIEHRGAGADNAYEYRLAGPCETPPPVPRKQTARQRIEELYAENQRLRERIAQLEAGGAP